ncbi:hypothetical protein Peur_047130 [Populus x canadensis]
MLMVNFELGSFKFCSRLWQICKMGQFKLLSGKWDGTPSLVFGSKARQVLHMIRCGQHKSELLECVVSGSVCFEINVLKIQNRSSYLQFNELDF